MSRPEVVSRRHPDLVWIRELRRSGSRRRADAVVVVEGPTSVGEALEAGAAPRLVVASLDAGEATATLVQRCAAAGATSRWVPADVLGSVGDTRTPHDVVAVFAFACATEPTWPAVVAVDVADPGNMGTILRTAEAAGASCVVLSGGCDVRAPKVVRSAAGAHFHLPIVEVAAGAAARLLRKSALPGAAGSALESIALVLDGEEPLWDVAPGPVAWPRAVVLGSESHGLGADVAGACSRRVYVPHRGRAESLNVAVAAGVAAFWLLAGPAAGPPAGPAADRT